MSVRMLLPHERGALEGHLLRLDRRSRTMRFECAMADAGVSRYVEGIDMRRDAVFGYFDGDCVLRGAAHVSVAGGTADLGISVEADHRGRGHGARLLGRAVDWSRFRAARLSAQCLASNGWMAARMRRLGAEVERDHETSFASLSLRPGDMALACRSILSEQAGWMSYGLAAATRRSSGRLTHA